MALTLGPVRRYHELQLGTGGMKPMNEQHFAILRRHMVEVIGIHTDLLEEELGKATFEKRILTTLLRVPRHLFVPEALAHARVSGYAAADRVREDDFSTVHVCAHDGPPCP